MGKVTGNWITGTHSGRACRHEDIYTKVNKKTGRCYSVKLCNPNTKWTEGQLSQRTSFGAISSAISTWISVSSAETAADHAEYKKVKKLFDRQNKYATMRGMMYGKGMYTINADGSVTVNVAATTSGASSSGNGSGSGGSGSDTDTGGSGTGSGELG